jgi:hypothetical protein
MKWIIATAILCITFVACNRELDPQPNNPNTGRVRLSEVVYCLDSIQNGNLQTDSSTYQLVYNSNNVVTGMFRKPVQPPGISYYALDSMLFTYAGGKLTQKKIYYAGHPFQSEHLIYSNGKLVQTVHGGPGNPQPYQVNYFYPSPANTLLVSSVSPPIKDSVVIFNNAVGDMSRSYASTSWLPGQIFYDLRLTYTNLTNKLRELINNDELFSVIMGIDVTYLPGVKQPDSLYLYNQENLRYSLKVILQQDADGNILKMNNYFYKGHLVGAANFSRFPYVYLRYENY